MSDVYVSCGVRQVSKTEDALESLFIEGVEAMLREFDEAYPDAVGTELDAIVLTIALCYCPDTGSCFLAHSEQEITVGQSVIVEKNDDGLYNVINQTT